MGLTIQYSEIPDFVAWLADLEKLKAAPISKLWFLQMYQNGAGEEHSNPRSYLNKRKPAGKLSNPKAPLPAFCF